MNEAIKMMIELLGWKVINDYCIAISQKWLNKQSIDPHSEEIKAMLYMVFDKNKEIHITKATDKQVYFYKQFPEAGI